jgi:hypothetical protein
MRKPAATSLLCPWGQQAGHKSNHDSNDPLFHINSSPLQDTWRSYSQLYARFLRKAKVIFANDAVSAVLPRGTLNLAMPATVGQAPRRAAIPVKFKL